MKGSANFRFKGFSLTELLTVLSILAIVASILLPVLSHSKKSAKSSDEAASFKSSYQALILYATNFDDYYPYELSDLDAVLVNSGKSSPFKRSLIPSPTIGLCSLLERIVSRPLCVSPLDQLAPEFAGASKATKWKQYVNSSFNSSSELGLDHFNFTMEHDCGDWPILWQHNFEKLGVKAENMSFISKSGAVRKFPWIKVSEMLQCVSDAHPNVFTQ
jgi:prepilin-type N-terminal cleavage/methylation domain-containing protein